MVPGEDEMTGATTPSELTVTVGWSPFSGSSTPPLWTLEKASAVQTPTPVESGATAEKVNTTLSPWSIAEAPASAVRFIVVADMLHVQEAGVRIVTGGETVNPSGIDTLAEPKALVPVSVMVIENVESWLTFTSVGDMVAVNE
jgi:hypothetical protein